MGSHISQNQGASEQFDVNEHLKKIQNKPEQFEQQQNSTNAQHKQKINGNFEKSQENLFIQDLKSRKAFRSKEKLNSSSQSLTSLTSQSSTNSIGYSSKVKQSISYTNFQAIFDQTSQKNQKHDNIIDKNNEYNLQKKIDLEDKSDCSSENNDSLTNYQDNSKFTNLAATQTMSLRYSETVETVLVKQDLQEMEQILDKGECQRVSFAAESSHNSYLHMLYTQDYIIGDYTEKKLILDYYRNELIVLITDLHKQKQYKVETLYIATGIADNYLSQLSCSNLPTPDLTCLGLVAILIAAKLEQPISPSFNRMIILVSEEQRKTVTKQKLIDLEFQIVFKMQFSLQIASPTLFAERYVYLLCQKYETEQILFVTKLILRYLNHYAFLRLKNKSSTIAAAAVILAINISCSKTLSEALSLDLMNYNKKPGVFSVWTDEIVEVTKIKREDLYQIYSSLLIQVDQMLLNLLSKDKDIWL